MNTRSGEMSGFGYEETENTGSKDLYKVLIGALAGAAVGSLVTGLFTQKGIEIRHRVGEGSNNMASNFKDKVSDISEVVADKYESAKEVVADKYGAVKEGAADLIEKGKEKIGMSQRSNAYSSNTAYTDTTETDKSGSGSQILLGAIILSVAGTLVWSFATEKGSETRRRIAESSKDMAGNLKDQVSTAASDIKDVLANVYESAKEGATDLMEQGEQRLKTL